MNAHRQFLNISRSDLQNVEFHYLFWWCPSAPLNTPYFRSFARILRHGVESVATLCANPQICLTPSPHMLRSSLVHCSVPAGPPHCFH